ncbi:hypothetical protein WR25_21697 [Diploscapter pachys]|uniref:Uncharacterized protein n=1 Tax=Diploscapter pachys TaxID=2018661 RepID=A0A2A2LBV1_9BILA|nr:hypothetical protein WR25_21697 [Diploscapter pachys]
MKTKIVFSGAPICIPRARMSVSYVGPYVHDEASAPTNLAPPPPPSYDQSAETTRAIQQTNAPPPYSENGVLRRVSTTSPPPVYNSLNSRINPRAPSAPPEEPSVERLENSESQNLESPRIRTLHVVIDCSKAEPSLFSINEESVI